MNSKQWDKQKPEKDCSLFLFQYNRPFHSVFSQFICDGAYQKIKILFQNLKNIYLTSFEYIFIGEMVVKHVGFGLEGYWQDPWNQFDGNVLFFNSYYL